MHPFITNQHRRDNGLISSTVSSRLSQLGVLLPDRNPVSADSAAWLGIDGPYINDFVNSSDEYVILVIWGPAGSWVNAITPIITVLIAAGGRQTISFANGTSGAWAPVYSDTRRSLYGQIDQTWGEYTFNGRWSTVDVSREVNMNGKPMKIITPNCISDFSRCVFQCVAGVSTCTIGYELFNCQSGSQPGANYGIDSNGAPTGGCSGMGDSARLTTVFS